MSGNPFSLSSDEVVVSALMLRNTMPLVLIVEGESDEKLIGRHVDRSSFGSVIAYGKMNALRSASQLDSSCAPLSIRVLVDRDGDDLGDFAPRVMTTEHWDLDAEVLFSTRVLSQVALAFTGEYEKWKLQDLKKSIASAAAPMSALLIVSKKLGLGISASRLVLPKGSGGSPLFERVNSIVRQAISKSGKAVDADLIVEKVHKVACDVEADLLCHQGHFLHAAIANLMGRGAHSDRVQSFVWGALVTEQFIATSVGRQFSEWARGNAVDIWMQDSISTAA